MTYTHNYIPYNCDLVLIHKVHALTYQALYNSSHSFHQFQAPNTWFFWVHFKPTRTVYNSPTDSPLSTHRFHFVESNTMATIGLMHTKHKLFNKLQHKHPKQSLKLSRTVQMGLMNSNILVPRFGTDQTATHNLNQLKPYKTLKSRVKQVG